jgi:hypothetical protein
MDQYLSHESGVGLPGLASLASLAPASSLTSSGVGGSFITTPQFKSIESYLCGICPAMLGVPLAAVSQAVHATICLRIDL